MTLLWKQVMPHFWYLVQNKIVNKHDVVNVFITDNAEYSEENHSLKVKLAVVDDVRVIFDDVIG